MVPDSASGSVQPQELDPNRHAAFWYEFARAHHLDIGEVGPNTTKTLALTAATSAQDLFDAMLVLSSLNQTHGTDWELLLQDGQRLLVVS